MDLRNSISRIAFIFLIFVVVSGGYISQILSCQMQNMLQNNLYAKHIIGVVMIFVFIMLEGGWDFNTKRQDKLPNDWSSGNTINTFIYAVGIYALFLISSKSQLIPNLCFFLLIFIIYMMNTYRNYTYERKEIKENTNKRFLNIEYILLSISFIILIYGLFDYIIYQQKMRGSDFNWLKFFIGVSKCDSV
tara:strand:- start:51 stop:620 length:570 start_codon:yes stop_codon:yes gene_type:complete